MSRRPSVSEPLEFSRYLSEFRARLERGFSGKSGEPTAAEIEKARNEMLRESRSKMPTDFAAERRQLESGLPAGIRLIDATFAEEGLRFTGRVALAFDRAALLAQIAMPASVGGAAPGRGGGKAKTPGPLDGPFQGLKVIDNGPTVTVTMPVLNPMSDQPFPGQGRGGGPPTDAETMKEVQQMLGNLRFGVSITTPFEVVRHSAHRQERETLVWDYDLKKLMKLTPKDLKSGITVTYRK